MTMVIYALPLSWGVFAVIFLNNLSKASMNYPLKNLVCSTVLCTSLRTLTPCKTNPK